MFVLYSLTWNCSLLVLVSLWICQSVQYLKSKEANLDIFEMLNLSPVGNHNNEIHYADETVAWLRCICCLLHCRTWAEFDETIPIGHVDLQCLTNLYSQAEATVPHYYSPQVACIASRVHLQLSASVYICVLQRPLFISYTVAFGKYSSSSPSSLSGEPSLSMFVVFLLIPLPGWSESSGVHGESYWWLRSCAPAGFVSLQVQ